ncbi:PAS domain S-box protein [Spirosoma sp. KCTC 42546]|uniref:PAS domain S-box protein n=1 Tax=Spirosoma sp. KCTC 42546 TaxID=2520506 RepID=UPI00143DE809|nr:PAS domain S-box protein [Spirosoma sp. KCTC 42546]
MPIIQPYPITGFAELTPSPRTLLFFTPRLNEQGQLVDLQLYPRETLAAQPDRPQLQRVYLSDWMDPQVRPSLNAFWLSLEKGIPCRLTYQPTPATLGQATVTPMNGGYLVEFLPPDPAPDPRWESRSTHLPGDERPPWSPSFLQSLYQRLPGQQAIIYAYEPPEQTLQPLNQKDGDKRPTPIPLAGTQMLREQQVIHCQQLEAHTPGIASLLGLFEGGYRCFMMLPLRKGEQLLGALVVAHEQAHFFTSRHRKRIQQLGMELTPSLSLRLNSAASLPPPPKATPQVLEAILSHTPVGLALFQPLKEGERIVDFVCAMSNPAHAALMGHRLADIVGKPLTTLFPGTLQIGLFERLVQVAQRGIPQHYQQQAELAGMSMWGRFSLVRVGQNVLVTVTDITELKLTQARLDHKNVQLEQRVVARSKQIHNLTVLQNAILKHGGQAIISTSIDAVIQTANQACEKLLGYSPHELLGQFVQVQPGTDDSPFPVISFQSSRPATGNPAAILQQTLNGETYRYLEGGAITKMGSTVPILLAAIALQDEQGTTIGYLGIASNISALKTAQARLLQKDRELSTFFENALDMHCISDSGGVISTVNKAFQATLGYSAAELKAIPFLHLIHPDEQKWVYQHRLQSILQQPVRNQINRMRCKDGTYRIIEWNAIAIDEVVYGSAHDITERQESETQLQLLNQRLQLATQAAGQGIWESNLETDSLIWDDRMWALHGLEPGRPDWSFKSYLNLIYPDDLAPFLAQSHLGQSGEKIWNLTRIVRPDGAIRYIETNGLLIMGPQGQPVQAIGVAWDVTERKLAEEALRESEQRFREIAENVDEVFWIHSADPFRLLYVNPAYERIWNRSLQSVYADTTSFMECIVAADQPAMQTLFRDYRAGQEGQLDFRIEQADGSRRWLSVRTFFVRDGAGRVARHLGIVNDITSQKEKERVLEQSLQREQELNQLKSQFVSTASHEFRTPLTTIQTSTELIELYLDVPTGQASIRQHIGVIYKEIEHVTELLSDMLTIGKIEAGRVSVSPRWLDPVALCTQLMATHYSGRSDHRRVQLELVGKPYQAYLDEKLMSHVLSNLLSNAFKFSAQDPKLTIHFGANELRLEVADSGIGIPAGDRANLFQAFFRASNTIGIPGTGLGLVIARQYVELHKGRLTVQSKHKKGSTFTIWLPHLPEDV